MCFDGPMSDPTHPTRGHTPRPVRADLVLLALGVVAIIAGVTLQPAPELAALTWLFIPVGWLFVIIGLVLLARRSSQRHQTANPTADGNGAPIIASHPYGDGSGSHRNADEFDGGGTDGGADGGGGGGGGD